MTLPEEPTLGRGQEAIETRPGPEVQNDLTLRHGRDRGRVSASEPQVGRFGYLRQLTC